MHHTTAFSDALTRRLEVSTGSFHRYQKFLYSITPEEFKKEWEEKKARKKEERAAKLREERRLRGEGSTSELASTSASLGGTKDSKKAALKETKKRKDEKAFSAEKDKEDDDDDSDHEPMPLYFQSPQQVLEVFTTLEVRHRSMLRRLPSAPVSVSRCVGRAVPWATGGTCVRTLAGLLWYFAGNRDTRSGTVVD